jgi:predicted subunit of tRNA(5-methylaminomethyl-2-thiouridylate) methyltransferase
MTRRAVALFSGGLDSTLAILAVLRQGVSVKAIKFQTPFDCSASKDPASVAERFGFSIEIRNLGEKFFEVVKDPEHGYGKNMNPCIDCRIMMLREARAFLDGGEADFIITGEVFGQRPMSQRKDMLYHIDKKAGVTNRVVRPLSAKLLRVTDAEARGIVSREMLYGFSGRSRKPQIDLAEEFGLADYPSPAGGCLLTEPNYACRLKDLMAFNPSPSLRDIDLLRIGRHFRYSPLCKIIIGRDRPENETIESLATDEDVLLKVNGYGSPLTLVSGEINQEALKVAASLCARYSDARNNFGVDVTDVNDPGFMLRVSAAGDELIDALRIEKKGIKKTSKALPVSP